jgi:hypothetical protein
MEGDIEGKPEALFVHAEKVLPEEKMPGARDRQELGQPLHYAQQDGF